MRYKKLEILYNNEKHFLGKNLGQNIFSIWKTERQQVLIICDINAI